MGEARAEALYDRVLAEYGDDSVAQLGGAHIAVEGASNLLTKVLQWGRLASYLEQSTRYIAFTDRPGGTTATTAPRPSIALPDLGRSYTRTLDGAFDAYSALLPLMVEHVAREVPELPGAAPAARERGAGAPRPHGACCRPRRPPTSGSSPLARRTRPCSFAWARTRCPRPASAPPAC